MMAEEACKVCRGSGKLGKTARCTTCRGTGIVNVNRRATGSAAKAPKKKKGWGW